MNQCKDGERRNLERWSWANPWLPVLIYMAAIFVLSSQPTLPSPPGIFGKDKFEHVLAYFGLGIIAFRGTSLKPLLSWPSRYLQALGIAALYGVTDEYHQSFVPGRRCEFYDWMADVLGAAVALSLIAILQFYRRKGGKRVERRRQGI